MGIVAKVHGAVVRLCTKCVAVIGWASNAALGEAATKLPPRGEVGGGDRTRNVGPGLPGVGASCGCHVETAPEPAGTDTDETGVELRLGLLAPDKPTTCLGSAALASPILCWDSAPMWPIACRSFRMNCASSAETHTEPPRRACDAELPAELQVVVLELMPSNWGVCGISVGDCGGSEAAPTCVDTEDVTDFLEAKGSNVSHSGSEDLSAARNDAGGDTGGGGLPAVVRTCCHMSASMFRNSTGTSTLAAPASHEVAFCGAFGEEGGEGSPGPSLKRATSRLMQES